MSAVLLACASASVGPPLPAPAGCTPLNAWRKTGVGTPRPAATSTSGRPWSTASVSWPPLICSVTVRVLAPVAPDGATATAAAAPAARIAPATAMGRRDMWSTSPGGRDARHHSEHVSEFAESLLRDRYWRPVGIRLGCARGRPHAGCMTHPQMTDDAHF